MDDPRRDTEAEDRLLDGLVERIRSGDREAFREVVMRLQQEIRIYLAWRAGSLDLTEEVLQETFIAVYENLSSYRPHGSFRAWVRGIARHRLLRALRDRQRENRFRAPGGQAMLAGLTAGLQRETDDDPTCDGRSLITRLRSCLGRLSQGNRELLQRHHGAGESLTDLAGRYGCSETALASRLYRLRRRLRYCLERSTP